MICSLDVALLLDISSESAAVRASGEDFLNRCLDTAASIGSKYLCGVLYSAMGKYSHPANDARMEHSASVLRRICARAKEMGITIALEPANRYETNIINTAADTVRFIERIGTDNAVVHLDAYHMHIEERYEDAINVCGSKAGYFHIGESHRGYLGTGNIVRFIIHSFADAEVSMCNH